MPTLEQFLQSANKVDSLLEALQQPDFYKALAKLPASTLMALAQELVTNRNTYDFPKLLETLFLTSLLHTKENFFLSDRDFRDLCSLILQQLLLVPEEDRPSIKDMEDYHPTAEVIAILKVLNRTINAFDNKNGKKYSALFVENMLIGIFLPLNFGTEHLEIDAIKKWLNDNSDEKLTLFATAIGNYVDTISPQWTVKTRVNSFISQWYSAPAAVVQVIRLATNLTTPPYTDASLEIAARIKAIAIKELTKDTLSEPEKNLFELIDSYYLAMDRLTEELHPVNALRG